LKNKKEMLVSTLRLLLAEVHNLEIEKKGKLTEDDVLGLIRKEVKKRKEAILAYKKGKREDLVKKEEKELAILNEYLPQPMSKEELEKIVEDVIGEMKAKGPQDFGQVMGQVMGKVKGRADGSLVSELVKKFLI